MFLPKLKILITMAALSLLAPLGALAQETLPMSEQNGDRLQIPFESFELDNGLQVYMIQDKTLPMINVNLWFDVGAKDEVVGRSGFAHLFEHLMFMGTEKVPEIDVLLESGGGSNNASTRDDLTNYYTIAPEHMLETVLYIEADRFKNLAQSMTQAKLDKQRDVVLNERKQTMVNQPYGKVWLEMPRLLYPEGHPYDHPVIGSVEDIEAATVQDVVDFFNHYYVPANALLVVAGDFEYPHAKALIQKYFDPIPKRPKPQSVVVPQLTHPQSQHKTLYDDVELPKLLMLWHSPAIFEPGDAELDILSSILCKGKNSRLINSLVYEQQLASTVYCGQMSGKASVFLIDAMPLPGVSLEQLQEALLAELDKILKEGVSETEFERTKLSIETSFASGLQAIASRADAFSSYRFYSGKDTFPAGDLERYRKSSTQSLKPIVQTLFGDPSRRATIHVLPNPKAPVITLPVPTLEEK